MKTQVTERIFKLTLIDASLIYYFTEFLFHLMNTQLNKDIITQKYLKYKSKQTVWTQ